MAMHCQPGYGAAAAVIPLGYVERALGAAAETWPLNRSPHSEILIWGAVTPGRVTMMRIPTIHEQDGTLLSKPFYPKTLPACVCRAATML
jgi:hypothetical protein